MLAGQRRFAEAIAQYHEALKAKPDYVAARVNLGRALADCGRLEDSIACYREALSLEPAAAAAHVNLAAVLGRQGKRRDAVAHFARRPACARRPRRPQLPGLDFGHLA